ncbi:MerR family transcriptional regulator, partial [Actinokineospora sp. PR83]|uniref:MerR family transcriptional regulator n=1 Tax=Actinokineospora sp. PR83 TaxID=2884908 RepID=UPI0035AC08F5
MGLPVRPPCDRSCRRSSWVVKWGFRTSRGGAVRPPTGGRRVGRVVGGTGRTSWTRESLARRLGVAPGALRAWELRYGLVPTVRVGPGKLRYGAADA